MRLTPQERAILDLLRSDPLLDAAALAERLGSTKASVAVALSNLTRKGAILGRGYVVRREKAVVVVGGAVMDVKARSAATLKPLTSNPGHVTTSPGGVGRNIAENLARLGTTTHLVAAVGADEFGGQLLARAREAGVLTHHMIASPRPTGTYLAVLDHLGDLSVAVSDLSATDALTIADVEPARPLLQNAAMLVVDGNLPVDVVSWLLDVARSGTVPVVLEPVSVAKAERLVPALAADRPVLAITPNLDELAALVGEAVADTAPAIRAAARSLHERGVEHVWVRRGVRGSILSSATDGGRPTTTTLDARAATVADVTGAGDAMTAGFAHAIVRGDTAAAAAAYGHVLAALTVASPHTVRPDLTDDLVRATSAHPDGSPR